MKRADKKALRELAEDIVKERVFVDRYLGQEANLIHSVFMPLMFLNKKQFREMKRDCGMIYEYYDKAGRMAINGFPMFFSMRYVHKKDVPIVFKYVKKLKKALEGVK